MKKPEERSRSLTWYYTNRHKLDRIARAAYMRRYYREHPEKWAPTEEKKARKNRRRREMYATDQAVRDEVKRNVAEWQRKNPKKRKQQRLRKYAMTVDAHAAMLAAQSGACAICGHSDTSKPNVFPLVDHCHATGTVRGLLCMSCNQGLGKFRDNPQLLETAAGYLRASVRAKTG